MLHKNEPIIIKRRKRGKRNHGHGGAWKVAFADFTLAMMALFMVLWIMQIADQKERTMIVQYLRGDMNPTGPINPFELSQSSSIIDLEGNMSIAPTIIPSHPSPRAGAEGIEEGALIPGQFDTQEQLTVLARQLNRVVQSSSMAENITVTIVPQGIRILIHDNVNRFMFTRGSAQMQPYFEELLLSLGPILKNITNSMVISGHTDSTPYAGSLFTNWELSSERALLARRVLERGGVKRDQVIQVTGMADQVPYITSDTAAAANRRIEALILTSSAEQLLRGMIGAPNETIQNGISINDIKRQTIAH
ncbi:MULTISPECIES: flagellar motor protein MotB [Shewanella]|uniref:flagellar motor protein MotB n=1 Tax=Shewanella TaxID=22 RepID=UPI00005FC9E7|nr:MULTISPECIES: flagellar motor protein MotB [Shewanella]ABM23343.1 OmpA/MotB domain protein [Shewanella sp. W3-18-1]MCA1899006.1 OmpA family protein [Shewanella putrefaciens]MCK7635470.1 OmpA family protein [Shewanella sp. JNE17]MCK7650696.1 OmpA family protein [Shewanella sp. JNE8]MCK7658945.1 OmpA family protein [Shewanella sp. JNE4-2]